MSKPVPPHEPYYYGILADAAYENDQAASESYIINPTGQQVTQAA